MKRILLAFSTLALTFAVGAFAQDGKAAGAPPPAGKADAAKPDAKKPDAKKSDAAKPADGAAKPVDGAGKKPNADKPSADKPAGEKPSAEKPTSDKPTADKPTAEKPTAEKPKKPFKSPIKLPKDYRKWAHATSMVIPAKDHPLYGFHHVYVEKKGQKAYEAKKALPNGSRIVVPFFEVVNEGGMISQGPLKMIAVMQKDKKAKDTGGYYYAAFDGAGKPIELDAKTACFECHTPQKDRDYIFSEWK